ncbi:MAG: hypothetical protein ACJ749_18715 [Flavisolibacter sp.]
MKLLHPVRLVLLATLLGFGACNKSDSPSPHQSTYELTYNQPVFYLKNQSDDYIVKPVNQPVDGSFTSFPKGLELDPKTGAINVSQSESGMRYKITFTPTTGSSVSTHVVISGINFPDRFYFLSNNDSTAFPVYNADPLNKLPSGNFDEGNEANNSGCAMKTTDGQINLKESIRRGLFGTVPENDTRKGFDIKYRLNDNSGNSLNRIKVLLYYYNSMNDVPEDLKATMSEHLAMTLQPDNTPMGNTLISAAAPKPRPPCIVIIAH